MARRAHALGRRRRRRRGRAAPPVAPADVPAPARRGEGGAGGRGGSAAVAATTARQRRSHSVRLDAAATARLTRRTPQATTRWLSRSAPRARRPWRFDRLGAENVLPRAGPRCCHPTRARRRPARWRRRVRCRTQDWQRSATDAAAEHADKPQPLRQLRQPAPRVGRVRPSAAAADAVAVAARACAPLVASRPNSLFPHAKRRQRKRRSMNPRRCPSRGARGAAGARTAPPHRRVRAASRPRGTR